MKKDDASLSADQYRKVRENARLALLRSEAIGRFPTPVADVMAAANLEEAPDDLLSPGLLSRLRKQAGDALKRAVSKVVGLFHASSRLVFIDRSLHVVKQTFIRLHETAHGFLPWQKDIYAVVEDSKESLAPDVADLFDREANVFASEVLFQLDSFITEAADHKFGVKVPLKLAKKYGSSTYAAIREYVRKNPLPCAVLVLNPPQLVPGDGFVAELRRIEESPRFQESCGKIRWPMRFTPDDSIGALVPLGKRRMTGKRALPLVDSMGVRRECVGEAFTNTYQVFVLLLLVEP